jgi:hypothetical protein
MVSLMMQSVFTKDAKRAKILIFSFRFWRFLVTSQ